MKRNGFRFWMSGCAAVISLALAGFGDKLTEDGDDDPKPGIWQLSRFDMAQTLQRLQACAPQHGLTVIACWSAKPAGMGPMADAADGAQRADSPTGSVLVFASRAGGTPVLMDNESATPDLPLSLRLRLRPDGKAEVLLPPDSLDYGTDLPSEVLVDLTELPGLVAQALA